MDKVNIGESTLKDFGNVINEAADILNKGKVAFDNSIPDKTLQVLPYTGQAGALIPSQIGDLNNLTTTAKDNLVNAINEVNDSLSSNTNVVTLDTDQTITGNKFFQEYELSDYFVRLYPTPKQIPVGGDNVTDYIAHLQGSILTGNNDIDNPKSLNIGVPYHSPLKFHGYSQGFGGVEFDASYFGGSIGGVNYENYHYKRLYRSAGVNLANEWGNHRANFILGAITALNQSEYFDGATELDGAILMEADDGLVFRLGDTGKIYINDKAKS